MNEQRLHELLGTVLQDLGGAMSVPLVRIGSKLDLFTKLNENGPYSSEDLASNADISERYAREWLAAMAASKYIDYDATTKKFSMNNEQAMVFANPDSPVFLVAGYDMAVNNILVQDQVQEAFKTGEGVSWGDQPQCLFCAVADFFRPGYLNNLVNDWLPSLDGVKDKLEAGINVADIGCGHGLSTIFMAQAFPNSTFVGIDLHEGSIESAREHVEKHGLTNVTFKVSTAQDFDGKYDFVTYFDCVHDMGDPVKAMQHTRESLNKGGSVMIVEPFAGDNLEDNLNPVGRLYYAASTMICVPTSLSQDVGLALGAQAGEKKLREVIVDQGGFSKLNRATETPFNIILQAS